MVSQREMASGPGGRWSASLFGPLGDGLSRAGSAGGHPRWGGAGTRRRASPFFPSRACVWLGKKGETRDRTLGFIPHSLSLALSPPGNDHNTLGCKFTCKRCNSKKFTSEERPQVSNKKVRDQRNTGEGVRVDISPRKTHGGRAAQEKMLDGTSRREMQISTRGQRDVKCYAIALDT